MIAHGSENPVDEILQVQKRADGDLDISQLKKVKIITPHQSPKISKQNIEARISVKAESKNHRKISRSLESLTVIKSPLERSKSSHSPKPSVFQT